LLRAESALRQRRARPHVVAGAPGAGRLARQRAPSRPWSTTTSSATPSTCAAATSRPAP